MKSNSIYHKSMWQYAKDNNYKRETINSILSKQNSRNLIIHLLLMTTPKRRVINQLNQEINVVYNNHL